MSPHVIAAAKLPILNPNEFDLWKMRIDQYFLMIDNSLWELIPNGDSPTPTSIVDGVVQVIAPTTAEQRLAKKNKLKARGTLLMALPDKHQSKFNIHKDAKSLMEDIEKRFGGNKETKKVQKTLLNSNMKTSVAQAQKALIKYMIGFKSLLANWRFLAPVFTLPNVDCLSDDVIYSFFASQSNSPQRFLQKNGRNLGANGKAAIGFDMSKVECYNSHKRGYFSRDCRSPRDNRNKDTLRRTIPVEVSTSNALMSQCDAVGSYDWSFQADEEPTNYAFMAYASSGSSSSLGSDNEVAPCSKACLKAYATLQSYYDNLTVDFRKSKIDVLSYKTDDSVPTSPVHDRYNSGEGYHVVPPSYTGTFMPPKPDLVFNDAPNASESIANMVPVESHTYKPSKDMSKTLRPDAPIIEDWTSDSEDESKIEYVPKQKEPIFVPATKHVKTPRASVKPVEHTKQVENIRTDNQKSKGQKNSWNRKSCFVCKSLNHLIKDCDYYEKQMVQKHVWNNAMRVNHHNPTRMSHPHSNRNVVPTVVLTRSGLVSLSAARPVPTVIQVSHGLGPQKTLIFLFDVKGNPQQALKDNGVINSGCSRHMTRNISFLSYFEEFNGGYVAFGGNPKGGKISRKGKIKRGELDFDDVYFVKELKFNLFSVSQMCDKKKSVLFTDTECVVLSSDYKLPDENHVLLRVPKENNMYNVDLKNVVPSRDLTCLFEKDTLDEMKGIKREFSVARTLQPNGVAERKNKTLIEVVRTMLADSLLPIPFWAEGVNTACYVQNRVLVPKPHNKTPYELLISRTSSISFMRPFGCPITILNTLDPLGKFDGKDDEGFMVGYSINSKAFRVFNSRTRIVQETLHINFLENQPNVAGSGPKWLFNIDTFTQSMNYQPVVAGNQPNHNAGIKEILNADPQHTDDVAAFNVKENENEVHVSPSSSDKPKKHDETAKRANNEKSPIELSTGVKDLRYEFEEFYVNSTNRVNAASAPITVVGPNLSNSTNSFNTASPFDIAISPNFIISRKSSFVDPFNYPGDPYMPALEDIVYSDDEEDVGVEADLSNLERNIYVRSMERMIKEQGGLNQINDEDFHTLRIKAIRLFLAYASFMGFMAYQMDVKSTFLYRTIKEEVYVCQPLGFEDHDYPDKVYRLVKALYGLHQAPRACQDKYVTKILKKFGFIDVKSTSTPIKTEKPLIKNPDGKDVDVHIYRSMIGSLMYLTSSRPDIMFAVCACARLEVTPKV
nr:retrovirus-related Pol polyprotein from transposon TNT 1-94 [Tanacetum cinerariifolium]